MPAATVKYLAPFKALPWQIAPWRDLSSVLLLTGSAGGGKSRLAAEKVHAACLKYPGSTWVILRKAREWCSKSIIPFFWESVIGGEESGIKFNKSEGVFSYPNNSRVYSGGMIDDKQREGIRSIGGSGGIDGAWMEEANAFSRQDFDELRARIRHTAAPWRQLILTTNPDAPTHWIYTDLIQKQQAAVYFSHAVDNPHNAAEYVETLNSLQGVLGDRLRGGLWKSAAGAVYDEFDAEKHVIDPFQIPQGWRKIRSVDFGFTNPFVCQWWAINPEKKAMILYREIYMSQRIVEDHARDIVRLSGSEEIEQTIADHDAEDSATMRRHGIWTIKAIKDISSGIQAVKQRLASGRLLFFRNCTVEHDHVMEQQKNPTSTVSEITRYSWPQSDDGKPIKEVPIKINDHGMDAMRYAAIFLERGEGYGRVVVS